MLKNVVEPGRPQLLFGTCAMNGIWKATVTHLEYVILIAFPLSQWLHEHPPILCLNVHCLSATVLKGSSY